MKPSALPIQSASALSVVLLAENIPPSLRNLEQWLPWKLKLGGKNPQKIPVNASGYATDCKKRQNWRQLDAAVALVGKNGITGVGLALPKDPIPGRNLLVPLIAVDMDAKNCPDTQPRVLPQQFLDIIRRLNSYSEFSPSLKGGRILVLGRIDEIGSKTTIPMGNGREISFMQFDSYVTITGDTFPGYGGEVEERDKEIREIYSELQSSRDHNSILSKSTRSASRPDLSESAAAVTADRPCFDLLREASPEDIEKLLTGFDRNPVQDAKVRATWNRDRGPGTPYAFKDDSDSMYMSRIVQEVVMISRFFDWDPQEKACQFLVFFVDRYSIADKLSPGRVRNWLREAEQYRSHPPNNTPRCRVLL